MSQCRRTVPVALAALLSLLVLSAAAAAEPADRTLQLDEQLAQRIEDAVAYVSVEYTKPNSTRGYVESGSAFVVAAGYLVTNHHVVAEAVNSAGASLKVRVFSGSDRSQFYPAEVVKADARADLALLRITGEPPAITPLQIAPDLPGKQTEVFAFGFPLGTMLDRSRNGPNVCLRRGYVSRLINDGSSIEADLNIDKGISGGPLVDKEGVVRGVVRAMAGSDYNKSYAGLSVASPILLAFCASTPARLTLRGGQLAAPGGEIQLPLQGGEEPDPRPRAGLGEDDLRAFFAIGSALRLSTLVPQMLASRQKVYSADIRQTSRNNADLVLTNLRKVQAPSELLQRTRELGTLLSQGSSEPRLVGERSAALEQACDQWVQEVPAEEKLNYDLGAWLTELSLGLLDVTDDKDLRSCAYFVQAADRQSATGEVTGMLRRLQASLTSLKAKPTDELRRSITKDADRLIGIGYLATSSRGLNPLPKPNGPTLPGRGANNPIHHNDD